MAAPGTAAPPPPATRPRCGRTAESSPRYDRLTQGAGFLDAKRAVELARNWSAPDLFVPWMTTAIVIGANDDGGGLVWGTNDDDGGVVWGTDDDGEGVVWGTSCSDPSCEPVVWKNP